MYDMGVNLKNTKKNSLNKNVQLKEVLNYTKLDESLSLKSFDFK